LFAIVKETHFDAYLLLRGDIYRHNRQGCSILPVFSRSLRSERRAHLRAADDLEFPAIICSFRKSIRSHEVLHLPPNSDVLELLAVICSFRKSIRSHEALHLPPNSDVLELLAVICNFRKSNRSHEALHLPPIF
jgi:hypothetical protein